jgi:8-oxo-dGTP pyrophosphatase MutT (NUDIX family)
MAKKTPATPVPAATIMLLRETSSSPEVLMLERHAASEFLPDLYVFPGGRVDPGDHEMADRVGGLTAEQASARAQSVAPETALGFFVAAIRETFEEAGVLLARHRGEQGLIGGELASELSAHRLDVQAGKQSLREIVEAHDLELAADCLAVHAHWITPAIVPRRFDTLFFSAKAPEGHTAAHDGVESSDHVWIRPEEALEQGKRKQRQMIFPTLANLQTIAGFGDVDAVLTSSRDRKVVPITPTLVGQGDDRKLVIGADSGYPMTEEKLELPGGAPKASPASPKDPQD